MNSWEICVFAVLTICAIGQPKEFKYKIKLEKLELIDHVEGWYNTTLRVSKFNKTQSVVNGNFENLRDMNLREMSFTLDSYINKLNQYVPSVIKMPKTNYCAVLQNDEYIAPGLMAHSNITKDCDVKKGSRYISNYFPEPNDNWMDELVGDKWRFDVKIWSDVDDKLVHEIKVYIDIDKTESIQNKMGPQAG